MPDLHEIQRSLYGAWRLGRRDPAGLGWLDVSADGFFRSFFAAVLVAPFYAVLVAMHRPEAADPGPLLLAEGLAYLTGWIAFPLLMIPLSRSLGLERNFATYIVAYNWAQLLIIAFWLPISAAGLLLPEGVGSIIATSGFLVVLWYLWTLTRLALGASPLAAAGVVLVEHLTTLVIHTGLARLTA